MLNEGIGMCAFLSGHAITSYLLPFVQYTFPLLHQPLLVLLCPPLACTLSFYRTEVFLGLFTKLNIHLIHLTHSQLSLFYHIPYFRAKFPVLFPGKHAHSFNSLFVAGEGNGHKLYIFLFLLFSHLGCRWECVSVSVCLCAFLSERAHLHCML